MTDALAPLRRLLPHPASHADDHTRLRAAIALMKHVRPVDREAEARTLAGTEGSDVSHPSDVMHRLHFWMLVASLAFVADAMETTKTSAAMRALHAEGEEVTRKALRLLREQPLVVGAFIPVTVAPVRPVSNRDASRTTGTETGHEPGQAVPVVPVRIRHRTRRT